MVNVYTLKTTPTYVHEAYAVGNHDRDGLGEIPLYT